jgi:hypothetical protein
MKGQNGGESLKRLKPTVGCNANRRRRGRRRRRLSFKPLNTELNPICYLLALLGGATVVDVSGLRVNQALYFLCFPKVILFY